MSFRAASSSAFVKDLNSSRKYILNQKPFRDPIYFNSIDVPQYSILIELSNLS